MMDPNLLAMFARGAQPGQPAPTMMPPGMPQLGMQQPGMQQQGMMPQGMPTMPPQQPPGPMPTMPPGAQQMPGPMQPAPRPGPPPIDASRVIRPVSGPMGGNRPNPATMGRGGDSIMAHMTPGEIAVPPQVQTPEVLATLNRAFAQMGANPTSFQAGHPDQKINPETGDPEFGWFDTLLPIGLGIAGSAIGGPFIGAGLADLGLGATAAGIGGAALGGAAGTTAGNLITGKPFGESLVRGAIGGLGSAAGGYIGSQFGSGPTPVAEIGPQAISANGDVGDFSPRAETPTGDFSPRSAATPSLFAQLISKQGIGSGIGGMVAGTLADSLYPPKAPASDLGPGLPPIGSTPNPIGTGSRTLSGPVNAGAPRFPGDEYLRNYGRRPQFNYFPS